MKYSLVTGGAGFIGSHLCKRLIDENFFVICIDNLITGSELNIAALNNNENFVFINYDVINPLNDILLKFKKIDYIFHLASPASPNKKSKKSYMNYPIETLLVNSYGTYNLLEIAKITDSRFLYASTSEIYGDPKVSPQSESYFGNVNPVGPRAVYDEGKRFGEAITMVYVRKFDIDGRIARIFNTYGENMQEDDGRVVSNFIIQALRNEPISIFGDGSQTRSFCYVSDLVDGLYNFMMRDGLEGEVINLGNPKEYTINAIADIIRKLTHSSSKIVHADLPEDDPKQRKPNIEKSKNLLDFSPKVEIEEGFEKTIEYFKKII